MSIFMCHAVATSAFFEQANPKSEMQWETESFEAKGAELARNSRRQRVARLTNQVASTWARGLDRLTRNSRAAQERKNLLERLENLPVHLLKDMGVSRNNTGQFCHFDDFGRYVELAPAAVEPKWAYVGWAVRTPMPGTAYAAQ